MRAGCYSPGFDPPRRFFNVQRDSQRAARTRPHWLSMPRRRSVLRSAAPHFWQPNVHHSFPRVMTPPPPESRYCCCGCSDCSCRGTRSARCYDCCSMTHHAAHGGRSGRPYASQGARGIISYPVKICKQSSLLKGHRPLRLPPEDRAPETKGTEHRVRESRTPPPPESRYRCSGSTDRPCRGTRSARCYDRCPMTHHAAHGGLLL